MKISEQIIAHIQKNPKITINELASFLSITTRAAEKQLRKLKEKNRIICIGANKGGYWQIVTKE